MKIIDTKGDILTGDNHPQLKIGDKLYLVDDRLSTFKKIQNIRENSSEDDDVDEEIVKLALGKDAANELLKKNDITFQGFANLTFFILSAITGQDYEELKKEARERKN